MSKIAPQDFLFKSKQTPIIDVRSPGEYDQGHIPGAINLPLFTNEERAIVGTIYKQTSKEAAILKGLEIVGPKMADFAKQALSLATNNHLLVHCWRGGMRSESMAWLFEKTGVKCDLLTGGYKAYRQYSATTLGSLTNLIVLEGHTGSGKTDIITELAKLNQQTIDLEALACHRGSSFGGIGMLPQPTTEQFQNNLFEKINNMNPTMPIWVEGESKAIGKVFLPVPFWESMSKAFVFDVEIPKSERVKQLVKDYACLDAQHMEAAILRLEKRLGGLNAKNCIDWFRGGEFHKVADLLLDYYDKTYQHSAEKNYPKRHIIKLPTTESIQNAQRLKQQLDATQQQL